MICPSCQKEAREGKVSKGVFTCARCQAAAKKAAWENQLIERYQGIAKMLERAQQMIYTVNFDLNSLKEFLAEHGINVPIANL